MIRGKLKTFIESEGQELFSRPSELQNSEWFLKYARKPNHILCLLCWSGLLEDSDNSPRKRVIARIIPALLILLTVDILAIYLIPFMDFFRFLIYLCTYIISVPIWFSMRRKRKQLTDFLRLLHVIYPQSMAPKISLILYGIYLSPVIAAALDTMSLYRPGIATHLAYGYDSDNLYAQIAIIFIKGVLYSAIYPTCPTVVAFLLCLFCQQICDRVSSLRFLIEKCSPEQFTVSFQSNILNHKRRIDDAMSLLQRVFYLPSFLICAASFCNCCSLIAWIYGSSAELSSMLAFFLYFFMSGVSLLACLWTAGGLPVELEAFSEEFHKKAQLRLIANGRTDGIDFERHLSERPVFVLTGCDIIHFKRSTILNLAGAVLTYTLLILKM